MRSDKAHRDVGGVIGFGVGIGHCAPAKAGVHLALFRLDANLGDGFLSSQEHKAAKLGSPSNIATNYAQSQKAAAR